MTINKLNNKKKAEFYTKNFSYWKKDKLINKDGFFIVYNEFLSKNILKNLSGNALKLYLFIGINSNNSTGESWYTIESFCKYFDKSPRTISYWLNELEHFNLIRRMQLKPNTPAHTFLQPY